MINKQNAQPDPASDKEQKAVQPEKGQQVDDSKKNTPSDLKGFAAIRAKEEAIKTGAAQAR